MSDPKQEAEGKTVLVTSESGPKGTGSEIPCLVFLYPQGPLMGRRLSLERETYVIGRVADADIQIDRESVSRKHARLTSHGGIWVIEDLGSTNGVLVNGHRVQRQALRDGDMVKIGEAILKFLAGENVEASYHEEIYRLTILDGLTGAHNKRYFLEYLGRELSASSRHGRPLSLVMLDIDHFKRINDTHGHLVGDHALKELASRIQPRVRQTDLFARYGGEEFAIVLRETDLGGAVAFAESVRQIVCATPFQLEQLSLPVTISMGVATREDEAAAAELIQRADEKLYAAKQAGRNRVMS